ncbi:hypothetical protein [Fulvivirga ligni]|uniref:hypothetical protein n=1 Tax=Fulvivirga ligni TaxID=2904246 RepID=UPI001F231D87|nr:hypothetical protein [Fulvivirga ligni]UII22312.1 hypothetical protein LVD16_03595 [Fulvivirga ligni]
MKYLLLIIFFSTNALFAYSQSLPKPEFTNVPYWWNSASNSLTLLSKETPDIKFGFWMGMKFSGNKSELEIPQNQLRLLIHSSQLNMQHLKLCKLKMKKKRRQVALVKLGFGVINIQEENLVDFNLKPAGENIYEIVLSDSLPPGQYAFINALDAFTFSVK